jgi:hypothetical protein
MSAFAAIIGGCIAVAFSIIGYLVAGIPGEIAGVLLGIALAGLVGIYTGSRT